ncbi:MAG: biopolymer transporter ExbD [Pirellulales bacterium]
MKVRNADRENEKIELQMTPMIDIVFQLLIFFIMTFKIVAQEGDFNIRMPAAGVPQSDPFVVETTTLKVRMKSNLEGVLTSITLDDRALTPPPSGSGADVFDVLRQRVLETVGDPTGPNSLAPDTEVEFECDYNLDYQYVIRGITAVSGKMEGNKVIKIIEKIKFAPPNKQG